MRYVPILVQPMPIRYAKSCFFMVSKPYEPLDGSLYLISTASTIQTASFREVASFLSYVHNRTVEVSGGQGTIESCLGIVNAKTHRRRMRIPSQIF